MADRPRTPPPLVAWLLFVAASVGTAAGMAQTFGQPFEREWLGRNGARYAHIARNYERDGLFAEGAAPRLDVAAHGDARPEVYAHHPPGLPAAIAVAGRLHGDDEPHAREDAARLVPALAALTALALLARLVAVVVGRQRGDPRAGLWTAATSTALVAAMPMTHVYGAHPDPQGAPVLAGSLLVLVVYERWLARPGRAWALALAGATLVASCFDWYGLYAPGLCALHLWVTQPARRRGAVGLAVGTVALFAAWVAWLSSLPGMDVGRIVGAAGVRAAAALDGAGGERLGGYLAAWFADTRALMPGWWALLAVPVAVALRRSPGEAPGRLGVRGLATLLVVPPLLHAAVFPSGLLVHDYWLFGLPPALGFGVASVAARRFDWRLVAAGVALYAAVGAGRGGEVLEQGVDPVPARLGTALAAHTAPGDVVLTSYAANPFSARPEGYTMMQPAITFYADRLVRGGIVDLEPAALDGRSFDEALAWATERAGPGGDVWFLLDAWTARPSAALRDAVVSRSAAGPLLLDPSVDVSLHRMRTSGR